MPTHLHDQSILYLNHGAFGGTPKELLDEQHRLRLIMESEPVDFLVRNNEARWFEAIAPVARFLNADVDGSLTRVRSAPSRGTINAAQPARSTSSLGRQRD